LIFVIDTSSAKSALAIIDDSGDVGEEATLPARSPELMGLMRAMASRHPLTGVAVATGPGSFTGLRMGVSFGLGLAMGLKIPIVPLPTLDLQAARSDEPVTAVSEAGRGRLYYQVPGRKPALGEAAEIPQTHGLVGFVSPSVEAALAKAGHRFKPESELRHLAGAAAALLKTAREVPYGSLKLEYMQSFAARAK
jgi:tRNA threonylcarbamoyl adenosine modification protein YeaZ